MNTYTQNPSEIKTPYRRKYQFLIYLSLVVTIAAVYLPVSNYEFLKYDDDTYVTDNQHVRGGLSSKNIKWAFTAGHASNWHPVTWLSHMLDCQFFGLQPGAHHIVNVLFHIANTLLLLYLLSLMTHTLWPPVFAAAVFALHPLHIESVAWIAERKDLLSTFFGLLTIIAYVRYTKRRKPGEYFAVLVFFVLGLMAKPMLVTIPFVLLLLDYWPLGRFRFDNTWKKSVPALIAEKIP
ncbi:unnamed protein product, partial [marine sediment metagenome]